MNTYKIKLITSEREIMELQSGWDGLYERLHQQLTVFQSWSWNYSWWMAFKQHIDSLALFVMEDRNCVCGLLPLAFYKPPHADDHQYSLRFLGAWHSDYHDWLIEPYVAPYFLEEILDRLGSMTVAGITLTDLPPWSSLPQSLETIAQNKTLQMTSGTSHVCPYIALPDSWSSYLETRTPKMRKNIQNAQRNVSKYNSSFSICNSRTDLAAYQAHFLDLHDRWWVKKEVQAGESSVLAEPQARQFLSDVTERLFAKGMLHFSIQQDSHDIISSFITFVQRQSLAYYLSGINPDYAHRSPGVAHIAALMEYAIEKGYKEFDFLRGDELYKFRWNTGGHETRWYEVQLHGCS
jgi:CelD/BcsL family acetyltransferase involved in cellulose biosynthesis